MVEPSTSETIALKQFAINVSHPGMDSPMEVQGQFQMTSQSQVNIDNLLVLHFILQSIDGTGSPAHLLYQYMQGFIHPSHVVYEEMVLNMENHEQVINNA